jgi:hypothetical protein
MAHYLMISRKSLYRAGLLIAHFHPSPKCHLHRKLRVPSGHFPRDLVDIDFVCTSFCPEAVIVLVIDDSVDIERGISVRLGESNSRCLPPTRSKSEAGKRGSEGRDAFDGGGGLAGREADGGTFVLGVPGGDCEPCEEDCG